ncbi:4-(cytidine 5'-diphospho)-2-C-methyl-D-erythritol kinase [Pseudooceanicola sp.]|uniref:4-(cytidine 5'-diphospho)-2-C-methyl-D-erythritol kinase n=1 Tax=Pseudooceanicola sp. TaxID=1914328 RepID=UPI0035C74A79
MQTPGAERDFAPAKINLTLHVTGQRPDGYHLLDSLVVFADIGDHLTVTPATETSLTITGPRARGIPDGPENLVCRAAEAFGQPAQITLEKHLPAMAGIGGGSSDAAATLRALSRATSRPIPPGALSLGADVPVCVTATAARMQGIGEVVTPVPKLPELHGVLVNPGVDVPTPRVFARLGNRTNPPMPQELPSWASTADLIDWLHTTRNDLEAPAQALAPEIAETLNVLRDDPACPLARMSGSGATCLALTDTRKAAEDMATRLARPQWWVQPVSLT